MQCPSQRPGPRRSPSLGYLGDSTFQDACSSEPNPYPLLPQAAASHSTSIRSHEHHRPPEPAWAPRHHTHTLVLLTFQPWAGFTTSANNCVGGVGVKEAATIIKEDLLGEVVGVPGVQIMRECRLRLRPSGPALPPLHTTQNNMYWAPGCPDVQPQQGPYPPCRAAAAAAAAGGGGGISWRFASRLRGTSCCKPLQVRSCRARALPVPQSSANENSGSCRETCSEGTAAPPPTCMRAAGQRQLPPDSPLANTPPQRKLLPMSSLARTPNPFINLDTHPGLRLLRPSLFAVTPAPLPPEHTSSDQFLRHLCAKPPPATQSRPVSQRLTRTPATQLLLYSTARQRNAPRSPG